MNIQPLTDKEFYNFKSLIYKLAGINLSEEKRALVAGRLQKRLRYYGFDSYSQYYNFVTNDNEVEKQTMVDLLTTNETYFFREPDHFDFLRDLVQGEWQNRSNLRIWSAACSTGEEVYSIAMI